MKEGGSIVGSPVMQLMRTTPWTCRLRQSVQLFQRWICFVLKGSRVPSLHLHYHFYAFSSSGTHPPFLCALCSLSRAHAESQRGSAKENERERERRSGREGARKTSDTGAHVNHLCERSSRGPASTPTPTVVTGRHEHRCARTERLKQAKMRVREGEEELMRVE